MNRVSFDQGWHTQFLTKIQKLGGFRELAPMRRSASERAAISPKDEDLDEIHPRGRDCDECVRMALDLLPRSSR